MAAVDYNHAVEQDAIGVGAQNDVIGVLGGSAAPWDAYVNVPVGSRYFKSDGTWYYKSGAGDTAGDWTALDIVGSECACPQDNELYWMLI